MSHNSLDVKNHLPLELLTSLELLRSAVGVQLPIRALTLPTTSTIRNPTVQDFIVDRIICDSALCRFPRTLYTRRVLESLIRVLDEAEAESREADADEDVRQNVP